MTIMIMMNMLIITMAWSILTTNNPMTISLIIMSISIMTSIMYALTLSSWYALILFLIYMGGMMVMFSYFVSLCSNDSMMMKSKMHFILFPIIMYKMLFMYIPMLYFTSTNLNNLFMKTNMIILLIMMLILLMMMIIIMKIIKMENGPLRMFYMY